MKPYWRYRLFWNDGGDAGEAEYVERIKPGDLVWLRGGQKVRVIDVVETPEGDRLTIDGRDSATS